MTNKIEYTWDVFISHASEDKKDLALPLSEELQKRNLKVWIDSGQISLGDSLRRKIDEGLSKSSYGVVILSKDFFKKEWPAKELDALVAREDGQEKVIIPVWHGVDLSEVVKFSPLLASKLAIKSDKGIPSLAEAIEYVIKSSLSSEDLFSLDDLYALSEAIRHTISREGSFSSLDPLSTIQGKIRKDSQLIRIRDFTKTELAVILKSINENIMYVNSYKYPVPEEAANKFRARIIDPLMHLRTKIMSAL